MQGKEEIKMIEISTSILSVKEENSVKTFYNLETAKTDYFHIDVMDGKFVENNTTEQMRQYAENIRQISNSQLDVHLMVKEPNEYIEEYIPLEPSFITIHYEAFNNKEELLKTINKIKENGMKCGLAIKPKTDISEIYEYLKYIHMVLIMTVEPGKGGQKLIPETIDKIRKLKEYITENNIDIFIEADGGINQENIEELSQAGIDIAVAGSSIISAEDYADTIKKLKNA